MEGQPQTGNVPDSHLMNLALSEPLHIPLAAATVADKFAMIAMIIMA